MIDFVFLKIDLWSNYKTAMTTRVMPVQEILPCCQLPQPPKTQNREQYLSTYHAQWPLKKRYCLLIAKGTTIVWISWNSILMKSLLSCQKIPRKTYTTVEIRLRLLGWLRGVYYPVSTLSVRQSS